MPATAELAIQADGSRQEIQRSADTLAADILRAVLPADFSAAVAEGPR